VKTHTHIGQPYAECEVKILHLTLPHGTIQKMSDFTWKHSYKYTIDEI